MHNTNIDVKLTNNLNQIDEFINNIDLEDLGLILKQATTEIENGIKGKNAYEGLDEI